MDYETFKQRIEELGDLDVPTPEQEESLVRGQDTIHLSVGIGYKLIDGNIVARDEVSGGEMFIRGLDLVQEREAIRGKDYILTCYWKANGLVSMALHTTHSFLSEEDF